MTLLFLLLLRADVATVDTLVYWSKLALICELNVFQGSGLEGVQQLESEMIALTSCGMTALAILTAQETRSVVGMDASLRVLSQVSRTVSSHFV